VSDGASWERHGGRHHPQRYEEGEETMPHRKEHPCDAYVRSTNRFVIIVLVFSAALLIVLGMYSCSRSTQPQTPVLIQGR